MSTLHQHHWYNRQSLEAHLTVIGPGDSLVIYGTPDETDYHWLLNHEALPHNRWYLVINPTCPHMQEQLINHQQWLKLITQHHNTFVWKS
jgi:hypothetical protein